jgi:hypothetical protein
MKVMLPIFYWIKWDELMKDELAERLFRTCFGNFGYDFICVFGDNEWKALCHCPLGMQCSEATYHYELVPRRIKKQLENAG